jgi:hypothetical protein
MLIGNQLRRCALPQRTGGEPPRQASDPGTLPARLVANLAGRSARCTCGGNGFGSEHVMIEFQGCYFGQDLIIWAVREVCDRTQDRANPAGPKSTLKISLEVAA